MMWGLIEEIPPMSRHLVNLESIFGDLESRYGPEDGMVLEVKSEIDSCKSLAHEKHPGLFATRNKLAAQDAPLSPTLRPKPGIQA